MGSEKPNKCKLSVKSYLRRQNLRRMFFSSVLFEMCIIGAGIYFGQEQAKIENLALFFQILGSMGIYFLICGAYSGTLIRKGRILVKPVIYHCFWAVNLILMVCCGLLIIPTESIPFFLCAFVVLWGNVPLFQKVEFMFHGLAVGIGGIFLLVNAAPTIMEIFYVSVIFFLSCQLSRKKCYYKACQMKKEKEDSNVVAFTEFDPLTGLDSRVGIENKAKSLWSTCVEEKKYISVFTIHMDEFSKYNEYYGYYEGEYCQKQIAEKIRELTPVAEDGLAARLLDGEFLVVLPALDGMKSIQWANILKDTIEGLEIPQAQEASGDYMTVSIGISCAKPNKNSVFAALRLESNRSLRVAKESGFNCVVYKKQRHGQKIESNKRPSAI